MSTSPPGFGPLPSTGPPSTTPDNVGITSGPSDSTTLRLVATIVPIVIIVAITIWALLVSGGVTHHRRAQYEAASADSLPSSPYGEKWPEGLQEPKLWEVLLEQRSQAGEEQNFNPLSVEVQSELATLPYSKGHSLRKKGPSILETKSKKRWRTFTATLPIESATQQVRVNILIAMPSPEHTWHDFGTCAIGTREVTYRTSPSESKREALTSQEDVSDTPILMDIASRGYMV